MVWLIIGIVAGLLAWVFLAPLSIHIDTRVPVARFSWKGIAQATLTWKQEEGWLHYQVFFFKRGVCITRPSPARKKKPPRPAGKKKRATISARRIGGVLNTFRFPVWYISLDPDTPYNAWLYPLNYLVGPEHCHINFYGSNYLVLEARNNLARMAYAWWR